MKDSPIGHWFLCKVLHPPLGRVARNERRGRTGNQRCRSGAVGYHPSPAATASDPPEGQRRSELFDAESTNYKHEAQASEIRSNLLTHLLALRAYISGRKPVTALPIGHWFLCKVLHPPLGRVARNERGGRTGNQRCRSRAVGHHPSPAATASDPPEGRVKSCIPLVAEMCRDQCPLEKSGTRSGKGKAEWRFSNRPLVKPPFRWIVNTCTLSGGCRRSTVVRRLAVALTLINKGAN